MPAPRLDQVTKEGAHHLARAKAAALKIEAARAEQSRWAATRAVEVRAAMAAGVSRAQVARELGMSVTAVTNILERHGKATGATTPAQL